MRYLCQLDYPDIPYPTRMGMPEEERKPTTVKSSGCGLCSACMVVDLLTDKTFTLEDAVKLSIESKANMKAGTDMTIFGPAFAERFGLEVKRTDDLNEAIVHLQNGGKIIAHVGVPEGKPIGLFTKGGHYIVLTATDGKSFCILDPSYAPGKFDIPQRAGRVDDKNAPYLYCDVETVFGEGRIGRIRYHLFSRKRAE